MKRCNKGKKIENILYRNNFLYIYLIQENLEVLQVAIRRRYENENST